MMMMMNCFCGMVDRRKAFSLISSRGHCQRSSPSRVSNTPRAGFEPAQNLSSDLVEWSCAIMITITPRRHILLDRTKNLTKIFKYSKHFPENLQYFSWTGSLLRDIDNNWVIFNGNKYRSRNREILNKCRSI